MNRNRARLGFFVVLVALVAGATAEAAAAVSAEGDSAGVARAGKIREGFAKVEADYARVKNDIAGLIRVRFELEPALLLPGEDVTLAITARSDTPPNPALEVVENCCEVTPNVRAFPLEWQKRATPEGIVYTATWKWKPPQCGNYLVRWKCDVGGDVPEFSRNFSVIDRTYAVMIVNSTSHREPRPEPDLHELRLPFSFWAESLLFGSRATAEDFAKFSRWSRQFGDDPGLMVFLGGDYLPEDKTVLYDEPEAVQRTVLECYQKLWPMLGFTRPLRSLYTYGMGNGPVRVARSLGFNLLGALCADQNWGDGPFKINHWGMPARPYFVSAEDFRKPGAGSPDAMIGVQQCERHTAGCRDYHCVYAFEGGIAYALDQYAGITRPRIVNEMILSRELDFLECFLACAGQTDAPYFFSGGIEFNGVWPDMAAINRHFMQRLVARARTAPLAFTTATAAADFYRRHYDRTPESVLYLPDVFAGVTNGGKPTHYPDTLEIENAEFRAVFRRGETLPYAQYDYAVRWDYPDWGNDSIPRKPDGYVVPNTDDRFRVTPRILDTRPFKVTTRTEETAELLVTIEVEATIAQKNLALAVWDLPREYSPGAAGYRLTGATRFIPVRAPCTENLCGILVADIKEGQNRITLTITTKPRPPRTIDLALGEPAAGGGQPMAKVFERPGHATAYLYSTAATPMNIHLSPPANSQAKLYPFDSDAPTVSVDEASRLVSGTRRDASSTDAPAILAGPIDITLEPGKPQRITGLTFDQLLQSCPSAKPITMWDMAHAVASPTP